MSVSRTFAKTTSLVIMLALAGCGKNVAVLSTAAAGPAPSVSMVQEAEGPPPGAAPDVPTVTVVHNSVVPDELIVGVAPGHRALLSVDASAKSPKTVREFDLGLHYQVVKIPAGMTRDAAKKKLAAEPGVKLVQENRIYATTMTPNDPDFHSQWGLQSNRINAPAAWDKHVDASNVIVAVIDTGVDYNHPDLAGRVLRGDNLADKTSDPMDDHGHGTHVAGIIGAAGNNGEGVAGVAWNCKILAIKVLGKDGGGSTDTVALGIKEAVDRGAKVINLSLGSSDPSPDPAIHDAVTYAHNHNVVVVAAAGNSHGQVGSPATEPNAIAVSSTSSFWVFEWMSLFSNYGDKIEVAAPGGGILSTLPSQGSSLGKMYGTLSGTSMAAPFVSGEAALIFAQHPDWTADQVRYRIDHAVDHKGSAGRNSKYGFGRIDLAAALD